MLNLPYSNIGGLGLPFNVTNCDQWYLYSIAEDAPEGTRDYFGTNSGYPIYKPESKGMINGETGIYQSACPEVNRATPYFNETVEG